MGARFIALLLLIATLATCAGGLAASRVQQDGGADGALGATAVPPESWEGIAWRLSASLVDPRARVQEEPLFLPKAIVRRFGRSDVHAPVVLSDLFNGWRVLAVEAADYPAGQIVSQIAASLARQRERDSQAVPETIVRALTPPTGEMAAAEQAAGRWLAATLAPQRNDKVAMVVLWNPRETKQPAFERLSFVLIKAGRLPDGRYRVQSLAYGTAEQAVLEGF